MHNLITENGIERRRQADHTNDILEEIRSNLGDMKGKVDTMQGYGAGIASVFGVIGAGIGLLWDKFNGH
jgi:hypothetical protein